MNFLAHLYLSGDDPGVMVGNFIGDFVKGKNFDNRFPPAVVKGIELHRSIDAFTDRHPLVSKSKARLRAKYGHYAGVIVDVYYDHLLAVHWSEFHPSPLPHFASTSYALIERHDEILPDGVKYMLPYMISGNWLVNYGTIEGIGRALRGMSRRTTFDSKMELAIEELIEHFGEFESEFLDFLPEVRSHSKSFLELQS